MSTPSVSVIIAVYNGAAFVADALRSIFAQSVPVQEVIVVDDGSTDNTAEIVRGFSGVRHVYQDNGGQPSALNHGVSLATSTWLTFLDADDLWVENKLALQLDAVFEQPDLELVYGHARQFLDRSVETRLQLPSDRELLPARVPGAALMRRSLIERIGTFREDLRIGSAVEWYTRAKDAGVKETTLEDVVLLRRIHEGNAGSAAQQSAGYFALVRSVLARRRNLDRS